MKNILGLIVALVTVLALNAQSPRVPGQILVQTPSEDLAHSLVEHPFHIGDRRIDLHYKKLVSAPLGVHLLTYDVGTEAQDQRLLEAIRNHSAVSIAQFNHRLSSRCQEVNDPQYPEQWHHANDGINGALENADIDTDLAWGISTGGTTAFNDTIVVCVIEGGNLNHPDLAANAWINHQEIPGNGIDDDQNGYVDDYLGWNVATHSDDGVLSGGHGTRVMGMIGARGGNQLGVVGANHHVKIMSVAGENLNDEASVVAAYTYPLVMRRRYNESSGATGAFVVVTNASWGLDFGDPQEVPLWSAVYDSLGVHGVLNCAATTNSNVNVDEVGDIPTTVASDYMVAVTATNSADQRTFSGYGSTSIDLAAPGENVFTTSGSNGYGGSTGTSFASPLTAGVIALLYSAPCPELASAAITDPQSTADLIKQTLLDGVDVLPQLIGETVTGGRLNAFNSLLMLMEDCPNAACLPPVGLTHHLSADTVHTLSWIAVNDTTVDLRFKAENDELWTTITGWQGDSYTLDTLRRCASYTVEMRSTCQADSTFDTCITFSTSGCCTAPNAHSVVDLSDTAFELTWPAAFEVTEYEVFHRLTGASTWSDGLLTTDTSITLSGLTPCSDYDFFIHPTCSNNPIFGRLGTHRTLGCGWCIDHAYCETGGSNSNFEYIDEVVIGDVTLTTGNDQGYVLFEDSPLVFAPGDTLEVTLTPGFGFGAYDEYFRIWLDADQNGEFTSDEILFSSEQPSGEPVEGQVVIPSSTLLGSTRLRVSMKFIDDPPGGPAIDPCELFEYGETEDYCVAIDETTGTTSIASPVTLSPYPNPTSGPLHLRFEGNGDRPAGMRLSVFDVQGRRMWSETVIDHTVDLSALDAGLYTYVLVDEASTFRATGKLVIQNLTRQ